MSIHHDPSKTSTSTLPPTASSPHERLFILSSHLSSTNSTTSTSSSAPALSTTMAARPLITCHVLDTTTGRPASGISVKLFCVSFQDIEFVGTTNTDGRIASWENKQGDNGREEGWIKQKGGVMAALSAITGEQGRVRNAVGPEGSSLWKLVFDTGAHYGIGNTFFPVVELSFLVKADEHFHVPLLLGPYSFTTYRGS